MKLLGLRLRKRKNKQVEGLGLPRYSLYDGFCESYGSSTEHARIDNQKTVFYIK